MTLVPFPQHNKKQELNKRVPKLLKEFKKLPINILLVKSLDQRLSYMTFWKDIPSKKELGIFEMGALVKVKPSNVTLLLADEGSITF